MIPLSRPAFLGTELEYVGGILQAGTLSGLGPYTRRCEQWLEQFMDSGKAFLTTSGTAALEMAAMLADIQAGDEVIVPSYTYVSTVNAFVVRGAAPVFVDIEHDTMNMDATKVEAAITPKTRAIVPVHYAGIACDMDVIMAVANRNNLLVIEDAAQAPTSTYKGRALGTIGHIGCMSFHETKNFTSGGQGGAVLVNRDALVDRAEVIHDNGTNRARFLRGQVDQYAWQDIGSNFVVSEVLAAILWSHLEAADEISQKRHQLWSEYQQRLEPLAAAGYIVLPYIPLGSVHNAHIYYIKVRDPHQRKALIRHMKAQGITTAPHYLPLHSTEIGSSKGRFAGSDINTTLASTQLLRLPLYHSLSVQEQDKVVATISSFWG
ncbi:MAG: hypothetical protein M1840_000202 [Geoglossum simile]|nr:MAG: hypothetical protein M1840_000202 [Geoglossum simile]